MKFAGLKTEDGRWIARRVRIACSFKHRLVGLLGVDTLASDEGLMLSPGGSIHTFGMRYPIDVAFLDRQLRILRVSSKIAPWRVCRAPAKTKHVVELPAGTLSQLRLEINTFVCLESEEDQPECQRADIARNSCSSEIRFSLRMPTSSRCSLSGSSPRPGCTTQRMDASFRTPDSAA
jgi:uncharacterized membrane protein (UPF0127 family)